MPRFKLSWTETVMFEAEVIARDKLEAEQLWKDWDEQVYNTCEEVEFLEMSDEVEIEEINGNINSID